MTKKSTARFLPNFLKSKQDTVSKPPGTEAPLKKLYHRVIPERNKQPRYECQYCFDTKKSTDFIQGAALPYQCQYHLGTKDNRVCNRYLEGWLGAQLDCKTLLEIACPECNAPWDPDEVKYLVSRQDRKKFDVLEEMARQVTMVPEDMPEKVTTGFLLSSGARFCPWCRWPFIKDGGCDAMQCIKCSKCFNIEYALILEDDEGNRAGPVLEEPDVTTF